jgi:phosphomethylpyrimidine synthase
MLRSEESLAFVLADASNSRTPLPASTRIYVTGNIHPSVRVPMREIALSDTVSFDGQIHHNPAVRVYDCSGPWGDPVFSGSSDQGLPPMRHDWILARNDVETYPGRPVQPLDNGYLSESHAAFASLAERSNRCIEFPGLNGHRRQPLRHGPRTLTRDPTPLCPARHHHPGDGVHCHPRKPQDRGGLIADRGSQRRHGPQ